jgi:hypothetical protein
VSAKWAKAAGRRVDHTRRSFERGIYRMKRVMGGREVTYCAGRLVDLRHDMDANCDALPVYGPEISTRK